MQIERPGNYYGVRAFINYKYAQTIKKFQKIAICQLQFAIICVIISFFF